MRVLMRRDQVHKICANHFVTANMELKPNAGSTKSWVWNTMADFADEEAKPEQLAVRFKNAETAEVFKEKFDHCKKLVTEHVEQQNFPKAIEKKKEFITDDLFAKFKSKPGSWNCDACLVNNPQEHTACSACTTARPGGEAAQITQHAFGSVSPSQAKPDGFEDFLTKYKPKPGSWECESCLVRNDADKTACNACGSPKVVAGSDTDHQIPTTKPQFHFVAPAVSGKPSAGFTFTLGSQSKVSAEPERPKFQFGSGITPQQKTDTAFTFGAPPEQSGSIPETGIQNSFKFGSAPVTNTAASQSVTGGSSALDDALEKCKPKPGSWECDSCLITNNADVSACAACGTPKSGASVTTSGPGATFGFPSGQGNFVGEKESTGSVFTFGVAPVSTSATPSATFGSAAESTSEADSEDDNDDGGDGDDDDDDDDIFQGEEESPSTEGESVALEDALEKYRPKPGAWECDVCLVSNTASVSACAACGTTKPGATPTTSTPSFPFGMTSSTDNSIGEKPGPSFTFGVAGKGFAFTTPRTNSITEKPSFTFGVPTGSNEPQTTSTPKFSFGAPLGMPAPGSSPSASLLSPQNRASFTFGSPSGSFFQSRDKDGESKDESSRVAPETRRETQEITELATERYKEVQKKTMTTDGVTETEDQEALETELVPRTVCKTVDKEKQETAESAEKSVMTDGTDTSLSIKSKSVDASTETLEKIALTKGQASDTDIPSGEEHTPLAKAKGNANKSNDEELTFVKACEPTTEEIRRAEKLLLPKAFYLFEREPEELQSETDPPSSGSLPFTQGRAKTDHADDLLEEPKNSTSDSENALGEVAQHRSPVFGAGKPESSLSFASIASSDSQVGFAKISSKGFAGKGSHLFGSYLNDGEHDPEQEDDLHFQPVIPLPEKIEVISGEEDETVLFCNRVKLYRFDKNTSQWKERGLGDIKILHHQKTKKPRILMRREQIHKICANHNITVDMQLRPNSGSDRSWMWQTLADFSDEVPQAEQLAVRFKTVPLAQQFKTVFEECQQGLRDSSPSRKVHEIAAIFDTGAKLLPSKSKELTKELSAGDMLFSVSEKVKPTQRGWKCRGCGVFNNEGILNCVACSQHKPPVSKNEDTQFREPVLVEKEPGSWECNTCYVVNAPDDKACCACTGPKSTTGKEQDAEVKIQPDNSSILATTKSQASAKLDDSSLDVQESSDTIQGTSATSSSDREADDKSDTHKSDGESSGKFLFGSSDIGILSFADIAKKSPSGSGLFGGISSTKSKPFTGSGSQLFQSPTCEDGDDEAAQAHDESGDHIHFEPVVPLPEKIEVKTGEEDEELVFKERCKLYRFDKDTKQWKERGVGDIKLLQDPKIGRARVVMRREQIHKLCANHLITADMELKPNAGSEKSWVWQTMADYSEGGASAEQLAVRFKTVDSAREFKEKFDSLKDEGKPPKEQDSVDNQTSQSNTSGTITETDSTTAYPDKTSKGELEGSDISDKSKQGPPPLEQHQPDSTGDIFPTSAEPDTLPSQPLSSDVSNVGGKMIHSRSTSETTQSRCQVQNSSLSTIDSSSVRQVQSSSITQTRVVHQEVKSVQQMRTVQVAHTAASGKMTGVEELTDGAFVKPISPIRSPTFASPFPHQAVTPMSGGVQDLDPSKMNPAMASMLQKPRYPGMASTQQLSKQIQETKQVNLSQQESGHVMLNYQSVDRESRHVTQRHHETRQVTQEQHSVENIRVGRVQSETSPHVATSPTSPRQPILSCSPEITRMLEEVGSSEDSEVNSNQ